jgi:glycerol-3-phosphate dehydrogenase
MNSPTNAFVRPASLDGRHFSAVVIGAGINGAGTFRDLCLQGVDCLLIDKADFGAGASSAPSRMIHGGLRYLENGEFALVAEATRERNLLLRNAVHLVRPLSTVIPLSSWFGGLVASAWRFIGRSRAAGSRGLLAVALGLRLYDWLGRRERVMPAHRIGRVPPADRALFSSNVRWTAQYFDAWITHPEWLILELIADACHDQPLSAAANHCRLVSCIGDTLLLHDEIDGRQVEVSADVVINATGAWLDRCNASISGPGERVHGTKGSHLVLDHPELHAALGGRMVYFEAADGRVCIAYPFLDRVLVGSTDIPVDDPDDITTEPAEIDYLLDVLREVFPQLSFDRQLIVYTFVGVRPLARSNAAQPGKISRDHEVVVDGPGGSRTIPVVSLIGGKWTTFRALAEEATDQALGLLARPRLRSTQQLAIGGASGLPAGPAAVAQVAAQIAAASAIDLPRAHDLLGRYGSKAAALARRFVAAGDTRLRHLPDYSAAELRYLCLATGAVRLDDLVIRRTLLAIRGRLNDDALAEIADIAAAAWGWSASRRDAELLACSATLREHHHTRVASPHAGTTSPADASSVPLHADLPTPA